MLYLYLYIHRIHIYCIYIIARSQVVWKSRDCKQLHGSAIWQASAETPQKSQSGEITLHYNDVIMGVIASQITSLSIVYSIVYSDADQRKQQSSASLAFVRGIHREPVNSPHKKPVTRKMFPFDDVIMKPISRLFEKFSGKTSCVLVNRWPNKANLRNLIAATSLVILLKLD